MFHFSEEELSQIYGGIVVKKPVKVENSDHFPHLSKSDLERSKAGKDDPGGNIDIFIKMKKLELFFTCSDKKRAILHRVTHTS